MKLGCIVQGDLRVPVEPILRELRKHCDTLILSTWEDQKDVIPPGNYFQSILNVKPAEAGITNRNLQRKTTAAGLKLAQELGCTHILKWRTDMLPTRLCRDSLATWARYSPVKPFSSRIVMPAFRNLTVDPDWFSSFPDHFAFGETALLKEMWSDDQFDYTLRYNVPPQMIKECGISTTDDGQILLNGTSYPAANIYDAHVELYAVFKDRVQKRVGRPWTHRELARDLLYLVDHRRLGICWLKTTGLTPYRSILRAAAVPWWTEKRWRRGSPPRKLRVGHVFNCWERSVGRMTSNFRVYHEMALQMFWRFKHSKLNF